MFGMHIWMCTVWTAAIDFDALVARRVAAPWRPPIKSATDTSNFDTVGAFQTP